VYPEDRDRTLDAINRAIERKIDFDLECRIVRTDGEVRWLLARGRPHYEGGVAVSMAGVVIDITARKRLEEKLRQSQKLESLGCTGRRRRP